MTSEHLTHMILNAGLQFRILRLDMYNSLPLPQGTPTIRERLFVLQSQPTFVPSQIYGLLLTILLAAAFVGCKSEE